MDVEHTIALQRQLYGAPLGESLRRVTERLGLSQAAVAGILGVSAPMLSQLASGRRIKLGNPSAAARFQALLDLVEEVDDGWGPAALADRLAEVAHQESATLTGARPRTEHLESVAVSGVLRAVASGQELAEAAALLAEEHPRLAEVLQVYGTGSPQDARRHFERVAHLLPGSSPTSA